MKCPQCRIGLERKTVRGRTTEIDRCPKCGGIWFDDGEIAELLGSPDQGRISVPAEARVAPQLECPRCNEPLYLFAWPGTLTVAEGCRRCGGMRLDAGEFEEIRKAQIVARVQCPKCGHEQARAESCVQCGVIMAKAAEPAPRRERAAAAPMHGEIAGVKGTLIRFIDRSLSTMLDGIRNG